MGRARQGEVRIGTSGWAYPHWRKGAFYPRGVPARSELAYLAGRLGSVEVNGTFYSMTRPEVCDAWRAAVPEGFVFAVKASRYVTHMLKLRNCDTAVANFFAQGILRLGAALGPILWQLPPQLRFDRDRAARFFGALPRDVRAAERWARRHDARTDGRCALRAPDGRDHPLRHAVEVRHASWLEDEALTSFAREGIALVAADAAGKHPLSLVRTADFSYVRLHGAETLYASRYTDEEIAWWADTVAAWASAGSPVFVYFDNDGHAHAPWDALRLEAALGARLAPNAHRPHPTAEVVSSAART